MTTFRAGSRLHRADRGHEPMARLEILGHGIDLYVLAGGTGRTLAFGPGHLDGTPLPARQGVASWRGLRLAVGTLPR